MMLSILVLVFGRSLFTWCPSGVLRGELSWGRVLGAVPHTSLGVQRKQPLGFCWFSIISWSCNVQVIGSSGCFPFRSLYPVGGWVFGGGAGGAVEHSLQLGRLGFRAESTDEQSDPKHDSRW